MHFCPLFSRTYSRILATLILLLPSLACFAGEPDASDGESWTLSSHSGNVSIYSRIHPGTAIREFKAIGKVDASPKTVQAVLDDIDDYPHFMPFVTECRLIKREPNYIVTYQRISPPFCTDRDYSLRVRHETIPTPGGTAYFCRWAQTDAFGPPEREGTIRVKVNEGSWLLEPSDGNTTAATYWIYTDSGGSLPAWLNNKANQIAIGKLFDAVRKQAKDSKYAGTR